MRALLISLLGYSRKNPNRGVGGGGGRSRTWNFQGYQRNSMWNLQGLIKNKVEFPRVTKKNNVEFPGVFVFGLEISKGSKHNFVEYQRLSCVLSGISRGKVKNEFQGGFQKSISSTAPVWIFSGIAHSNKQTNQV